MKRRAALGAAVAVGAVGLGAGVALHQRRPAAAAPVNLLAARFDRPEGGQLDLGLLLRQRPVLLNFWATWCPPCVRELPLLERFHRDQGDRGWQVVGLAIDQPAAVRDFLAGVKVSYPIGVDADTGLALARRLGDTGGGLPFTALVAPDGSVERRKLGALEPGELERWAPRTG